MKKLLSFLFLMMVIFQPLEARATGAKSSQNGIKVAGTTEGNTGCMILEKHMPVKGKMLLLGVVYVRTEYDVLQTFNYNPPKQKFTGQGETDKLNSLAVKNKVKLVVLPSHYSQDQLKTARDICQAKPAS